MNRRPLRRSCAAAKSCAVVTPEVLEHIRRAEQLKNSIGKLPGTGGRLANQKNFLIQEKVDPRRCWTILDSLMDPKGRCDKDLFPRSPHS